jgi:hypothetical protein
MRESGFYSSLWSTSAPPLTSFPIMAVSRSTPQ